MFSELCAIYAPVVCQMSITCTVLTQINIAQNFSEIVFYLLPINIRVLGTYTTSFAGR
jgi:hypothetical protein